MAAQTSPPIEKKKAQEKTTAPIVKDLNANGLDDTKEVQTLNSKKTMRIGDQFIDANGDGICDNREQGLGFRRGKAQSVNQSGKRQQGRQK